MQWASLCSGGFLHNEAHNKYVACLVPDTVAAIKSKRKTWDHLNRQKQFLIMMDKVYV
jgi:hypothetical protein